MILDWLAAFAAIEVIPRKPAPDPEDTDDPVAPPEPIPRILTAAGLDQGKRPFTGSRQPIVTKLSKHTPRRRRRY